MPNWAAAASGPGTVTRAPPGGPRRMVTSESDSSSRNASRSVGRDTPNCSISSGSVGSHSPSVISPRAIIWRIRPATMSAIFCGRTR